MARYSQRCYLSCVDCQKNKRGVPSLAPNQAMPILTVPFEKMATDIVGPFPRSKFGYKYLLTTICLASKYPEVLPIKDMSAVTVAESMIEIFSRTGFPRVLLSDQGTQFVSSLLMALCERLGVARITTSTYHPQSIGCLERLHGTLVPMIRKAISDKLAWPEQVKYALFALRGMPATDTGRQFPSSLALLFDTWSEQQSKPVKLNVWLDKFDKRVESIRDSVRKKLDEVKKKNSELERKKLLRVLEKGDQLLLRAVELPDKLAQAWEGPYSVKRRIGMENYELDLSGRGRKTRATVIHVNNIKLWHPAIQRVVLAQDDAIDDGPRSLKRVYWIFVTKLMGGVNFWLQTRSGDENCYRGTLHICLKLRISIAIDQTVSVLISS